MTSVNWNNSPLSQVSTRPTSFNTTTAAGSTAQPSDELSDSVHLSPAALREVALTGQIALNAQAGNITSQQEAELNGQVSEIESQIKSDQQANGGTLSQSDAQTIQQLQSQLSQTIYSDAHNGATPPTDPNVTKAGVREALQAGRIALNETAGNLTSDQANQLYSQLGAIHQQIVTDKQSDGGSLNAADAKAIHQSLNQLSRQIHDTAHPNSV